MFSFVFGVEVGPEQGCAYRHIFPRAIVCGQGGRIICWALHTGSAPLCRRHTTGMKDWQHAFCSIVLSVLFFHLYKMALEKLAYLVEFRSLDLPAEAGKNEGNSLFSALLGCSSQAETSWDHRKGNAVLAGSVPACDDHVKWSWLGLPDCNCLLPWNSLHKTWSHNWILIYVVWNEYMSLSTRLPVFQCKNFYSLYSC